MRSFLKRLLPAKCRQEPYAREIAVTLIRGGFDPRILNELQALGSFKEDSHIFTFLAERNLSPEDAANAIRLATRRYYETRLVAEKNGWPLKRKQAATEWPRHEAYFLELLDEATERPPGA